MSFNFKYSLTNKINHRLIFRSYNFFKLIQTLFLTYTLDLLDFFRLLLPYLFEYPLCISNFGLVNFYDPHKFAIYADSDLDLLTCLLHKCLD